jgi:hypothetical protein
MSDDSGGLYNPDNTGCRKPILGFLAVVAGLAALLFFWL